MRAGALVLAALLAASPGIAADGPPRLSLPAACEIGRTCWVSNHVDVDPGEGARDHRCGAFTYDGHNGIDIALADEAAMARGVAVLATAPGTVRAVREGMADRSVAETGPQAVSERECGNGVVLDHGADWRTQYCHLRQGSLAVRVGERVEAGRELGRIGLSGLSEYPHLHMSLRHGGRVVDPFLGRAGAACGARPRPLWSAKARDALAYRPGVVFNAGIAARVPDMAAAGRGGLAAADAHAPALVVWAQAFAAAPGDALSLRLLGPDGAILAESEVVVERRQARILRYAGRRRAGPAWPPGRYVGEIVYHRAGESEGERRAVVIRIR